MIHPKLVPYVTNTVRGAGYRRKVKTYCRSGPHPMFDQLASFELSYKLGSRKWVLHFFSNTGTLVGRHQFDSFETSIQALTGAINSFYITHFPEIFDAAQPQPPTS